MKFDEIGFAEVELLGNRFESSSSEINHCVEGDPVNLCWIKHGRWKREHVLNRVQWSVWYGGGEQTSRWLHPDYHCPYKPADGHWSDILHWSPVTGHQDTLHLPDTLHCPPRHTVHCPVSKLPVQQRAVYAYNLCWPADRLIIPANNGRSAQLSAQLINTCYVILLNTHGD